MIIGFAIFGTGVAEDWAPLQILGALVIAGGAAALVVALVGRAG